MRIVYSSCLCQLPTNFSAAEAAYGISDLRNLFVENLDGQIGRHEEREREKERSK